MMKTLKEYIEKHSDFITGSLKSRLYKHGTYPNGEKIETFKSKNGNVYADYTIMIKSNKGQPVDRVTLNDTGVLYSSFVPKFGSDEFSIMFDDDKEDGKISDNIPYLDEAISLGEDGKNDLIKAVKKDIHNDFLEEAKTKILQIIR